MEIIISFIMSTVPVIMCGIIVSVIFAIIIYMRDSNIPIFNFIYWLLTKLFIIFLILGLFYVLIIPDKEERAEHFWEKEVYVLKEELYLEYTEDFENVQYHKASCPLIEDKEVLKITMETAANEFYFPCEECNPEHW